MKPEILIIFAIVMSYGTLLAMFLLEKRLRKSAERREQGYKEICDDLRGALERQGEALKNLMAATSGQNAIGEARADNATSPHDQTL